NTVRMELPSWPNPVCLHCSVDARHLISRTIRRDPVGYINAADSRAAILEFSSLHRAPSGIGAFLRHKAKNRLRCFFLSPVAERLRSPIRERPSQRSDKRSGACSFAKGTEEGVSVGLDLVTLKRFDRRSWREEKE